METNLYRYIIRRSVRYQVILIVLIFGLAILNPAMLSLTKRIINQAIGKGNLDALIWLCSLYLGAVLASGALKYVKQNLEGLISEQMLRNLRIELYERILRFPLPHFRNTSTGQLIAMMLGEVEDLGNFFGEALSVPAFQGTMLLGTLGFMVWQNPWMALAGLALFPVQVFFVRKLQRRVTALSRERVRMVRRVSDHIQESVGGVHEIYANDTMAYETSGFRQQLKRIYRVRLKIYNLKYLVKWINNFLEKFGTFVLLLIGGWLIIMRPDQFDVGGLVAFLQAYNQLNEPWRELINYFQQRENARVKYEQVIAQFDVPGLRPEFGREEAPPEPVRTLAGAYDLRGVSVVFDGSTRALDHLQLSTPAHEHVAVAGAAGSGKTTLAMVLARLHGYTGAALLDEVELSRLPSAVAGRQMAFVSSEARLFTGTVLDNLIYGLRHRPATPVPAAAGGGPPQDDWLDLSPLGGADAAGLVATVLETTRLVGLDEDLFQFGLRTTVDPVKQPQLAERLLTARRLVIERFAGEGGEASVEFFDRDRFTVYASIGENIMFGHSGSPSLAVDRLPESEHFRRVIDEVELRGDLLTLGVEIAREMVEIFKDIAPDNELFVNFSLITPSELPEYARIVSRLERLERTMPAGLPRDDQERLVALSLRLIPARHRLGRIDETFMAKVVAARRRFAETLPADVADSFAPYDRERYLAGGTLLENILFGKVVATSSLAVKKVNALVAEVIREHGVREVVQEAGLGYHVGLFGSRLSVAQRQRVAVARALLKRPQILIMDRALSSLEPEHRAEMHQRITGVMKGRTAIAVVEALDLARFYDRVVVLDAGKVSEHATYQELVTRSPLFRRLGAQAGVSG